MTFGDVILAMPSMVMLFARVTITDDVIARVEDLDREQGQPVGYSHKLRYEWQPDTEIADLNDLQDGYPSPDYAVLILPKPVVDSIDPLSPPRIDLVSSGADIDDGKDVRNEPNLMLKRLYNIEYIVHNIFLMATDFIMSTNYN